MKVLYVVGTNLSRNTSANISHNAYVQGLLENGCEVDIIMASSSWGANDASLPTWKEATYFTYNAVSLIDRLKTKFKNIFDKQIATNGELAIKKDIHVVSLPPNGNLKKQIRNLLKTSYDFLFRTSQLYNLDRTWLKNGLKFKETKSYDLIISNSSPASSHKLVLNLLSKKRITETRWIQIWEDPWFYDLYGGHRDEVKEEEHRLLKAAREIFYVSILTLQYQKNHFQDCAHKMKHIPLPYLQFGENKPRKDGDNIKFGYYGDFYSKTRNITPFYEALIESGTPSCINGDSDLSLKSTQAVQVCGRVTLDKLSELQDKTDVLVHLCNLKGGQIPGKIYHYSATTKPILFILDGTEEEIIIIMDYFKKYDRYHFCANRKEEILKIMNLFLAGDEVLQKQPVLEFHPRHVISNLLYN
ncbi:hypothetical protein [Chryseobacterium sp. MP_3.2]|uniref:hypothetical protein n=1 Tax=Chryseobacterium sp. MP_3.2 TaxID=3071712 RepID=UPI002DFA3AF7|nr:hypothetical protein [Chryseobacterium sp. MP_3.2]